MLAAGMPCMTLFAQKKTEAAAVKPATDTAKPAPKKRTVLKTKPKAPTKKRAFLRFSRIRFREVCSCT